MLSEEHKNELIAFRDKALELFKATPAIFPDAPGIFFKFGPPDVNEIVKARSELHSETVLFYLYPAASGVSDEFLYNFLSGAGKILCSSLDENSYYYDKAGMLVALAPHKSLAFSIPVNMENALQDKIKKIHHAVDDALFNAKQSKISRLIYFRNSLCNSGRIFRDKKYFAKQAPEGASAVICCAGPSLAARLPLLKKHSEKLAIFCVGRVAPMLIEAGIMPDMIFHVDQAYDNDWSPKLKGISSVFVASASISPKVASYFEKILWFNGDSPSANAILKDGGAALTSFVLSRSVTVPALDMAICSGYSNIALLGSDLCFSESGKMHAASDAPNESKGKLEVESNSGGKVLTNYGFDSIRISIESYLEQKKKHGCLNVCNCTSHGAKINHADFMSFESFCEKFANGQKGKEILNETPNQGNAFFDFSATQATLEEYASTLAKEIECASGILRELKKTEPDIAKLTLLQNEFAPLQELDAALSAGRELKYILEPGESQITDILTELPELKKIDTSDPCAQLMLFVKRLSFLRDLCKDILGDLDFASGQRLTEQKYNPCIFAAFRNFAISHIARNNSELAEYLSSVEEIQKEKYEIVPCSQYLPVQITFPDNKLLFSYSPYSYNIVPVESCERFAKETGFDASLNGVVFLAPGNWMHVVEFAKRFPNADIVVLELWPKMFSEIINQSMFMQHLPESALVIAPGDRFKSWKRLYKERTQSWIN